MSPVGKGGLHRIQNHDVFVRKARMAKEVNSFGNRCSCVDRLVDNQDTSFPSSSPQECVSLRRGQAFPGTNCSPVCVSKGGFEISTQKRRQKRPRGAQPQHHDRPLRFWEGSDKLPAKFETI